jgi:enoyl-CoA hydratase/carnithine racemase
VTSSDFPNAGPVVPHVPLEQYQERFKELFTITRENGVIEAMAHTNGGPAQWIYGMHKGWGQLFRTIGEDPENEVLIIGGTGDRFINALDPAVLEHVEEALKADPSNWIKNTYDVQYTDGSALVNNLLWEVHIPTIGLINGPAPGHTEFPLACDLTLCADDVVFRDPHFSNNVVPGDGQFLIFQKLLGDKRANYLAYAGGEFDAKTALEWGVVNEVLPREQLLPRAREIAALIMKKDRYVRRLTHDLMRQSMRRHFSEDFNLHFAMETWGQTLSVMNGKTSMTEGWRRTNAAVDEEAAGTR